MNQFSPIFLVFLMLCFPCVSKSQDLTQQAIMVAISNDSGNPGENYSKYAESLRLTLLELSADQLGRVFAGTGVAETGLGDTGTGDTGTGDTGTGDTGTGDTGPTSSAPANDPAVDQPLIDLINGGLPPGQLKNQLIDASPLSEAVLSAFIGASQDLPAGIVLNVLMENAPLPEDVYMEILTGSTSLNAGQLANLSIAQNEE